MITREAILADLEDIAALSKQLKPQSKEADIKSVFAKIITREDHTVIVCVGSSNRIVGYVHALIRMIIGNPISIEVGGIAIQNEYRREGIGTLLLAKVEDWAKQNRIGVITLASSVRRVDAHNFYVKNGYVRHRERTHFMKEIELL